MSRKVEEMVETVKVPLTPGQKRARASKGKGYRGEVEVISLLNGILKEEYQRAGSGAPPELARSPHGRDIRGVSWISIEVKRHEPTAAGEQFSRYKIGQWWNQCKTNTLAGQESVLIYRGNGMPWRVRMFGRLKLASSPTAAIRCPVDIEIESFLNWFRMMVQAKLKPAPDCPGPTALASVT